MSEKETDKKKWMISFPFTLQFNRIFSRIAGDNRRIF